MLITLLTIRKYQSITFCIVKLPFYIYTIRVFISYNKYHLGIINDIQQPSEGGFWVFTKRLSSYKRFKISPLDSPESNLSPDDSRDYGK